MECQTGLSNKLQTVSWSFMPNRELSYIFNFGLRTHRAEALVLFT